MRVLYILFFCSLFQLACDSNKSNPSDALKPTQETAITPKKEDSTKAQAAQKEGKASASTLQNLSTGFWHIGGAVNTSEGGKGYVGEWIQFAKDQTYVFGKDGENLSNGVWIFDEDNEFITLKDDNNPEAYYAHQFQCKQLGDIILLLGNTPNNKRGTQIKLVRQDAKVIEHNPN